MISASHKNKFLFLFLWGKVLKEKLLVFGLVLKKI